MSDLYPEYLDLIEDLKYDVDIKDCLSKESKFKTKLYQKQKREFEESLRKIFFCKKNHFILGTFYSIL